MAEQTYDGLTPGQIPNPGRLPWLAKGVIITSGGNFVSSASSTFPTIPPGVSGMSINLQFPTDTVDWIITAPPAGTAPVGPASQLQTSVSYSSEELAYSPGTLSTAQTVVIQEGRLTAPETQGIFTGLARYFTVAFGGGLAGTNVNMTFLLNGAQYVINSAVPVPFGDAITFGFGQGSGLHLPASILFGPGSGIVDWEARLYY